MHPFPLYVTIFSMYLFPLDITIFSTHLFPLYVTIFSIHLFPLCVTFFSMHHSSKLQASRDQGVYLTPQYPKESKTNCTCNSVPERLLLIYKAMGSISRTPLQEGKKTSGVGKFLTNTRLKEENYIHYNKKQSCGNSTRNLPLILAGFRNLLPQNNPMRKNS